MKRLAIRLAPRPPRERILGRGKGRVGLSLEDKIAFVTLDGKAVAVWGRHRNAMDEWRLPGSHQAVAFLKRRGLWKPKPAAPERARR